MKRRIYWLLPDLDSARKTMDDLLLARVNVANLHFHAREGTDLSRLHEANVLQTSDLIRSAQMGLMLGVATGAVAGLLVAYYFPVIGNAPQWGIAALCAILGGALGAWSSSMIGISTPSVRLKRFASAIEQGQILLMVDVPRGRIHEIESLLEASHPEATLHGVEPGIPAFP